ncbi:unnamed protein product [Sphenostylis stenocarpa]|uniref:DUF7081 domain-containing protein n=1 Tax=Sphenostylis stenocarpa TaxID=92480 RepID=A0AA86SLP6_9FABA|nr:unnamed protein product [Sphenostylis stenocarpa]
MKEQKWGRKMGKVSPHSSGEGLPYAPQGWPNLGDVWGWKVLNRTNKAGYFVDRSLYLPTSLQNSSSKRPRLKTRPDDMLVMPHPENSQDHAPVTNTVDNQTIVLQGKTFFLLSGDFPSLISCNNAVMQLQSKRKEICGALESMQEPKVELSCGEASVTNSILILVGEIIHLGMSENQNGSRRKPTLSSV